MFLNIAHEFTTKKRKLAQQGFEFLNPILPTKSERLD